MIRDGIGLFYFTQPVDSDDQAISLVEYLSWHGWSAFKDDSEHDQVTVPLECASEEDAATKSATLYSLVKNWHAFWEHRDKGVFGLPVYIKD